MSGEIENIRNYPAAASGPSLLKVAGYNSNSIWRRPWFFLAKKLNKTVDELCETLTVEEMIGWAAYSEIEYDEYEKQKEQAQKSSALKGKRGRIR